MTPPALVVLRTCQRYKPSAHTLKWGKSPHVLLLWEKRGSSHGHMGCAFPAPAVQPLGEQGPEPGR